MTTYKDGEVSLCIFELSLDYSQELKEKYGESMNLFAALSVNGNDFKTQVMENCSLQTTWNRELKFKIVDSNKSLMLKIFHKPEDSEVVQIGICPVKCSSLIMGADLQE